MPKTLYIRNVPDDVAAQLATLAAQEGMSTSAFAARELTRVATTAHNAALLAALPRNSGFTPQDAVRAVHQGRIDSGRG